MRNQNFARVQENKIPESSFRWGYAIFVLFLLSILSFIAIGVISLFVGIDVESLSGNVALIPIQGVIVGSEDSEFLFESVTSSQDAVEFIEKADKNPSIKAIILEINSPGGSAVASEEIANAVRKTNKTTVAWIREVGASGAYWVASASDKIVASPMSITGSIGVISSYLEFSKLFEKYGVPQRRKRLVLVGSLLSQIKVAPSPNIKKTVRDAIGNLKSSDTTHDPLHRIVARHTPRIQNLINMIPTNGGSRTNLPKKYQLACHKKPNVGFKDIYGRLKWDSYSSTITGGCLNPSKGRFLHPEENRVITPREAALLQTFPKNYKFPLSISKAELALMIGNALPPEFSRIQTAHILDHIKSFNG